MRRLFLVAGIHFALSWVVSLTAAMASLNHNPVVRWAGVALIWAYFFPGLSTAWLWETGATREDTTITVLLFALNSVCWACAACVVWHYGRLIRASWCKRRTTAAGLLVLCGLVARLPADAKQPAAALALDLGGGVKLELVLVPAGTFTMGNDADRDAKPAHEVVVARPFYLGKYEVTQEQWAAVTGAAHAATTTRGADLPVDTVEWWEARALCEKLGAKFPGRRFRLPTEAEWEYACRAGGTGKYTFGDDAARLTDYAWYRRDDDRTPNPKVTGVADTHPVGLKRPNAWGLYDMHGNVWEWCHTRWKEYPYSATDGRETALPRPPGAVKTPRPLAEAHVVRGGSWHHGAKAATSYSRAASQPADHRYYYGCRVAMSVPE